MTLITAQMSVSLDGYYAGPRASHADTSDLQSWLETPEAAGFFRVTRWAIDAEAWRQRLGFSGGEKNVNSDIVAETFDSVGAYVMGRRMADGGEIPWGAEPPFRAPVFVVTHRPRPTLHQEDTSFTTYRRHELGHRTGPQAAKGKNFRVAGGGDPAPRSDRTRTGPRTSSSTSPRAHGDGMRLLDHQSNSTPGEGIQLTPALVTATDSALTSATESANDYPLVQDNRGNDEQARVA